MPYGLENDSTDDQLTAILHRLSQLETENSRLLNWRTKVVSNIHQPTGELLFLLNPSCYSNDNIRLLQLGLCTGTAAAGFNPYLDTPGAAPRTTQAGGPINIRARFMMLKSDLNWNEQALMHQFRADKLLLLATRIDARLLGIVKTDSSATDRDHTARFVHSPVLPRNTSSHPTMMDVDAIRRQPLTPAEREHRFRNGLCLVWLLKDI
ncbi:hypothetical protein BASA83_010417 [Batrachochytrium salamandrivorans]|nr:hypothetical protein BASA83_010417 [Batrachochytrium salamandrivorans]